jgi:hypothetical protein
MKNVFFTSTFLIVLIACSDNNNFNFAPAELNLVTSGNTTGKVTYTNLLATMPTLKSFLVGSVDVERISYNGVTYEIIVASRTNIQ